MARSQIQNQGYYIRINNEQVWLDSEAVRHGDLVIHEGSMSEQCDTCSADIAEHGILKRTKDHCRTVICRCGARYVVFQVEGKSYAGPGRKQR